MFNREERLAASRKDLEWAEHELKAYRDANDRAMQRYEELTTGRAVNPPPGVTPTTIVEAIERNERMISKYLDDVERFRRKTQELEQGR